MRTSRPRTRSRLPTLTSLRPPSAKNSRRTKWRPRLPTDNRSRRRRIRSRVQNPFSSSMGNAAVAPILPPASGPRSPPPLRAGHSPSRLPPPPHPPPPDPHTPPSPTPSTTRGPANARPSTAGATLESKQIDNIPESARSARETGGNAPRPRRTEKPPTRRHPPTQQKPAQTTIGRSARRPSTTITPLPLPPPQTPLGPAQPKWCGGT